MHEPKNMTALAFDEGDVVAQALGLIGDDGIGGIEQAFDLLSDANIDPAGVMAQPVLIEAIFQMLEGLEQDLASPPLYLLALRLAPGIAKAAADLLFIANFPEGTGDMSDLGDGSILLLVALETAAGRQSVGSALLQQAKLHRPGYRFQRAAVQLLLLTQNDSEAIAQRLFEMLLDDLDHPEIWATLPFVVERFPRLTDTISEIVGKEMMFYDGVWTILHALCVAAGGNPTEGRKLLEPLATEKSQSILVQGAFFHIQSMLDSANPIYDLSVRFCQTPFDVIDVLDGSSHLCCASWLPASVGNMAEEQWEDVWNSHTAQNIRASILDGSFRYCNKTACAKIGGNDLPMKEKLVSESDRWRDTIENFRTMLPTGPHRVNLAYDQTCNLSCPSCRTEKIAADSATRARYDKLQEDSILPMLRQAGLTFITGSGDPFASKNFRNLLDRLGPEDYPDLRFQVMTNGMLFTPREWARFPALHNRVASLRISLDAATGPTHELLRRGARWSVMESNLAFAKELRAQGLIASLDFSFTVQIDNYQEMGQAVDLGHRFGADHVSFLRLTNWGTFSPAQYARRAVFMPSHPRHADFLTVMQDPRLLDPIVQLCDMSSFVGQV